MRIVTDPSEARAILDEARADGASVGFMPTLGYMHEGHASNIRAARVASDLVVVSIFLNPTQFGANEDLDRYPRDDERDEQICEAEGVDLIVRPPVEAMYPTGPQISMSVGEIGSRLCGASRPGHFDGVATIVAKLFNMVGPCTGFFGQKDAQQLVVIRRMVEAFLFPVRIVACPTVREEDGLAMSSRNAYLTPGERKAAPMLAQALFDAADMFAAGERSAVRLVSQVSSMLRDEPLISIDYVACVDPASLEDLDRIEDGALLAAAVNLPSARLIDNVTLG